MRTIADLRIEIAEIDKLLKRHCRKYSTKRKIRKAPLDQRIKDYREFCELEISKTVKMLAICRVNQLYKLN